MITNDQFSDEVRAALGNWDEGDARLINALVVDVFTRWMGLPGGNTSEGFMNIYDEHSQRAIGAIAAIVEVIRDLGACRPNDILDALRTSRQ